MSVIRVSIQHGRTLEDARGRLQGAVGQVQGQFAALVQRVEWAPDRNGVKIVGKGFDIDMRLDARDLHVSGNLTFLGGLLSGPFAAGLKKILTHHFPKRLT